MDKSSTVNLQQRSVDSILPLV